MKRLGTVLHLVQKRLVVRGEPVDRNDTKIPLPNSAVINQKGKRIGRVSDVFGPLKHPYIIVRLNKGIDMSVHVGKKLYIGETSGRDDKWKR